MPEQGGLVDLTRQMAVLEERMDAMNERYDKGWKLLEAKMAEDTARLREDIAKRDTANTRWLIAVITAATAIIIAVMAVLLSNT